jgi:hypothetical protein
MVTTSERTRFAKRICLAAWLAVCGLAIGKAANANEHPNIYIDQATVAAIKAKVDAGVQPWKDAYDQVIAAANAIVNTPYSDIPMVTDNGGYGGDPHKWLTSKPYCGWDSNPDKSQCYIDRGCSGDCCDGCINPLADRSDYTDGIAVAAAVRDLGLAYAFSGNTEYADKALQYIDKWCINPDYYLKPQWTNFQSRIEIAISMPGIWYGADMLYNYAGWDPANRAAFQEWVAEFAYSFTQWSAQNNFENWRINFVASAGAFLYDDHYLDHAFNRWRALIPSQIDCNGYMVLEINRADGWQYSLFAIEAMIQSAEVARHRGINLYDYTVSDGECSKGLEMVLDRHAYCATHPGVWPHNGTAHPIGDDGNNGSFECAYSWYQKPEFLEALAPPPLYDRRILGWATLTHANRFEVDVDFTTYEAENATISGGRIVANHPGYSGTGYVDYINPSNDYVEWEVDMASSGDYDILFGYALGYGDRPLSIAVNGTIVEPSLAFPATGSWSEWSETAPLRVSLDSGVNTIRATAIGSSGANIDYLTVEECSGQYQVLSECS